MEVGEQLGGSDHRPVCLTMQYSVEHEPRFPRWNYKKADWNSYKDLTDDLCREIRVEGRDTNRVTGYINAVILKAAHKCIPLIREGLQAILEQRPGSSTGGFIIGQAGGRNKPISRKQHHVPTSQSQVP